MVLSTACPRCKGDLHTERDDYNNLERVCIQCGHREPAGRVVVGRKLVPERQAEQLPRQFHPATLPPEEEKERTVIESKPETKALSPIPPKPEKRSPHAMNKYYESNRAAGEPVLTCLPVVTIGK